MATYLCSCVLRRQCLSGASCNFEKNTEPIAVRYQRQLLEDSELTEKQRQYISPHKRQRKALGYRPFYSMRVTNYGSNPVPGYQIPTDLVSWTLTTVEVRTNVKGIIGIKNTNVFSFTTRFAGGEEFTARKMELESLMGPPPHKIMQVCRHVTDLAELIKRH